MLVQLQLAILIFSGQLTWARCLGHCAFPREIGHFQLTYHHRDIRGKSYNHSQVPGPLHSHTHKNPPLLCCADFSLVTDPLVARVSFAELALNFVGLLCQV